MSRWSWLHRAMMTDAGEEVHGDNNERTTSADATIAAGGHSEGQ